MHEKGISQQDVITTPDLAGVKQVVGNLDATGLTFGIVVSRFNDSLTTELVTTAITAMTKHGAKEEDITVVWVPGGYEVPCVIQELAKKGTYAALIGLGLVIQGETQHAEVINFEVGRALSEVSRQFAVPVIHEVVSAGNMEQAVVRCTGGEGSRGWYAGLAAIEMARVFEQVKE